MEVKLVLTPPGSDANDTYGLIIRIKDRTRGCVSVIKFVCVVEM